MKRISIILFLMMVSLGYTFAQSGTAQARGDRKTPEERAEMRTSKMTEELSLSADQASKLKELNLKQAKKLEAIREKQHTENQEARQEARAIATETENAYKSILTPEQYEKYQQNKAQKMQERKNGRKGQMKGRRN